MRASTERARSRVQPGGGASTAAVALVAAALAGACATRPAGDVDESWAALGAPKHYESPRATGPIAIDGFLDEPAWAVAAWSDPFVDIEGDVRPAPRFETRMKMVWDETFLYVAARLEEPHVWGALTRHDEIVFRDNDFEVFIDPDGDALAYVEIEINARNTIFDLSLTAPYRAGGKPDHDWNCAGLLSAVRIDGTLNDPSDTDAGWTVEMAIPWAALAPYARGAVPPRGGDTWRMNFSRVEWRHEVVDGGYAKVADAREDNWVWTPQGLIDMHVPVRWGSVSFVE